jgi:hypothetical protein
MPIAKKCTTTLFPLSNMDGQNANYAVRYNSGHSFEIRARFPASPFVKYWTLLVS